MFKGIQNILNKAAIKEQVEINEPGMLPILKANELLGSEKHQQAIQKLPETLNLDNMQFDAHCAVLIDHFAEFVQQLPETQNSYFSKPGGILEHGLHRAVLAASMCRAYFLPKETALQDILTHQQMLWAYAVFSAGLLHDIGKVVVDISVTIWDRYQRIPKPWVPWEGAMIGVGTDYKYEFSPLNQDQYRKRATLILARQLMPHQSYLWLTSNPDVLAAWLSMLEDDERGGGIIGAIILRADAEIIRRFFLENKLGIKSDKKVEKKADVKLSETSSTFEKIKSSDLASLAKATTAAVSVGADIGVGQEFMKWVQEAIERQTIKVNQKDSGVIRTTEGILLTQKVFEKFATANPQYGSWQTVANAVAKLGLHEVGPHNESAQHYVNISSKEGSSQQFSSLSQYAAAAAGKEGNLLSGIVIKNINMLFPLTIPPEVHQNFVKVPIGVIAPAQANTVMAKVLGDTAQPKADVKPAVTPPPAPTTITPSAR